jgi:hypothetical protein
MLRPRNRHLIWVCSFLASFLLLFTSVALNAQVLYGTLVGTVMDQSGALVVGATIKIVSVQTGDTRATVTNGNGIYTLSTIPSGTYSVTITAAGFGPFEENNVQVALNTVVRVDARLAVGNETQTLQISANGTSGSGTNVRIDGVSATNPWVQFYSTAVPSTEAIQTVNVVTSTSGADQGMSNAAAINVQIKSGTNQFHGSAYLYHLDNLSNARPYFLPTMSRLTKFIDNDAGATFGEGLLHDRLFFFGSYEGDFLHQGNSSIVTVPTAAIRTGDMSASSTPI